MDEGNSGSPGSCPPLSPLVLPRVPNAAPPPPHGQFPLALLILSVHPWELLSLEGIARGAYMAEALSPFLGLSGLDKMIPKRLVLGRLSFLVSSGGVSITRTCELEELGSL